jgi:alanine racemase
MIALLALRPLGAATARRRLAARPILMPVQPMAATRSPSPSQSSGVLTVDLAALADNWRALARRAGAAACGAVVKADAYGLGVEAVAPTLHAAGCRHFFVAQLSEGTRVRAALAPRPQASIYVLNGLQAGADPEADYCAHGLSPVIGSEEELARWAVFAEGHITPPPCAIHLDTGMNRLGFSSLAAIERAIGGHDREALGVDLLMSHFISSEERDNPLNAIQIARFDEARAAFRGVPASLANSSGAFLPERPLYDLIRPGYALYGGNPTPGAPNPMKPVVTLEVAIQQVRWIEAGESVGYNQQWTAPRRTRLATLLAGYADGLPRGAGATGRPGADVIVAGLRCPLVGRMSMDLCIADVTDLPEAVAQPGDSARLLGDAIGVDELAARSGTNGYQVLTSLGQRYHRRYVG